MSVYQDGYASSLCGNVIIGWKPMPLVVFILPLALIVHDSNRIGELGGRLPSQVLSERFRW